MNRLVLVGNGFDKAHGLKTGYEDFIGWYWSGWGNRLLKSKTDEEEDLLCSIKINPDSIASNWSDIWNFYCKKDNPLEKWNPFDAIIFAHARKEWSVFTFKSAFLENICKSKAEKPWVNIEEEFYALLKRSVNPQQLNDELEFIKNKLIEYLKSLQEATINFNIKEQILEPISKEDIAIVSMNKWKEMLKERLDYKDSEWDYLIKGYNTKKDVSHYSQNSVNKFKQIYQADILSENIDNIDENSCPTFFLPDNIMLLNFNYTNTAYKYLYADDDKFSVIPIHGSLSNPESIIFGYGDEKDDEYEVLMKKNDNEFLRHIKSFRYLDASNYRKMLAFIESAPYQLCIMGHSCGISDRTLLSTLFEHDNCVSIKPYYHKKDEGTDNYRELVQNIARNFKDPSMMRARVVGKERCEPLGKAREGHNNYAS